jgi:hypothetical protein
MDMINRLNKLAVQLQDAGVPFTAEILLYYPMSLDNIYHVDYYLEEDEFIEDFSFEYQDSTWLNVSGTLFASHLTNREGTLRRYLRSIFLRAGGYVDDIDVKFTTRLISYKRSDKTLEQMFLFEICSELGKQKVMDKPKWSGFYKTLDLGILDSDYRIFLHTPDIESHELKFIIYRSGDGYDTGKIFTIKDLKRKDATDQIIKIINQVKTGKIYI